MAFVTTMDELNEEFYEEAYTKIDKPSFFGFASFLLNMKTVFCRHCGGYAMDLASNYRGRSGAAIVPTHAQCHCGNIHMFPGWDTAVYHDLLMEDVAWAALMRAVRSRT